MDSYSDALNLVYLGEADNEIQVVGVLNEEEGRVRLSVNTFWTAEPRSLQFDLTVPLVTPVRFNQDEGIFGHIIRLPYSRTNRFCHPLLVCPFAESLASDRKKGGARFKFSKPEDWEFSWINWYGRVRRAVEGAITKLMASQQEATTGFVRTQFRKEISSLITPQESSTRPTGWAENGSNGGNVSSGLPVTDECLILRHMFEVRLGFPDVTNNDQLYELIKMRFVSHVDGFCDVCFTGKNHCAREVGRIFPGDPVSQVTGLPMPRLLRGMNPLAQIASPARVWRENRSCAGWLTFESPIEPPIQAQGVKLPEPFRQRVTTLMTAVLDVPGFNVFEATDQDRQDFPGRVKEGEEISLDGLLVTRTGQQKLQARVETAEVMTAEEFLPHMGDFEERPGFQYEEDPLEVECLSDGTRVFEYQYRVSWDREVRCRYDKVKCLCGGIKGVTRPISQLYAEIDGELVPIDMVISERTALSKGAIDLFLYPLLAHAGVAEVDPTWTKEQLIELAEAGLRRRDLPVTGRFPIYSIQRVPEINGKPLDENMAAALQEWGQKVWRRTVRTQVGEGIVGLLPFCRAQETEHRQSSASQGLSLNCHARVLGGVPVPIEEGTEEAISKTADFFYHNAPLASVGTMDRESDDL